MSEWRIERGGKTVVATEREVREDLRSGRLSGAEMVRPPGATGWLPLHTLAVFSEEVPVKRNAKRSADGRFARGWLVHLMLFSFVVVWAGRGTIPVWAMFWGIGVFAHTLKGLPATISVLQRWRGERAAHQTVHATVEMPAARPTPLPAPEPVKAPPTEFSTQVAEAVRAVQGVWAKGAHALGPLPDLDGLSRAADRLERRHKALMELHQDEDRTALEAELDGALSRQAEAPDAVTAQIFADEAAAIADRLAGIDAAQSVADQLAARKRTLLHQLAGLRLAAGQTAATHDGTEPARVADTLVEKTATLRDALRASAEVDDALVRARKAAAARRTARS
jgi:hypothetical protein